MALNCLMHQSIDHHHHPQTRTCGSVVDSEAIEQFVYFDIVATVLGKFEVDLQRQSWQRGKLPLFNQLVVATVWGHGVGAIAVNCRRKVKSAVPGGGGLRLWLCCCCYWPFGNCCFLRNTTTSSLSGIELKSPWVSKSVAELSHRSPLRFPTVLASCHFVKVVLFPFF